jgi:hypothetical protein
VEINLFWSEVVVGCWWSKQLTTGDGSRARPEGCEKEKTDSKESNPKEKFDEN